MWLGFRAAARGEGAGGGVYSASFPEKGQSPLLWPQDNEEGKVVLRYCTRRSGQEAEIGDEICQKTTANEERQCSAAA
jgi:hypothetical protein